MAGLIVITRPRDEAVALAAELTGRGYETLIEPMLDIAPLPISMPPLAPYAGLVFTSVNGVRIFAERSSERALPAYAVGTRTADALRDTGFVDIRQASGDAAALAALIQASRSSGRLLHVSGYDVARDLGRLLAPVIRIDRLVVYKAVAATAISTALTDALYARTIIHVLFFSVRTAETFGTLLRERGLADMIDLSSALCLSDKIADAARQFPWHSVAAASTPTAAALLGLLPASGASNAH